MNSQERVRIRALLGIGERLPDGLPGIRDIENPCDLFQPGEPHESATCFTDGHYICRECVHISAETLAYRETQ